MDCAFVHGEYIYSMHKDRVVFNAKGFLSFSSEVNPSESWDAQASTKATETALRFLDKLASSLESLPHIYLVLIASKSGSMGEHPIQEIQDKGHGRRYRPTPSYAVDAAPLFSSKGLVEFPVFMFLLFYFLNNFVQEHASHGSV